MNLNSFKKDYINWKYGGKSPLEKLIEKYPKIRWEWFEVSRNPNISIDTVRRLTLLDLPWSWQGLSENPNITIDIVKKWKGMPWDPRFLCCNPNITIEIMEQQKDIEWYITYFIPNPNITINDMEKHTKTWGYSHWSNFSQRCKVTIESLEKYPWIWKELSLNLNITEEMVERYIDKLWDWRMLSAHPAISIEFIEKHPEKPWDWSCVSSNPNLTADIIKKYPNKHWSVVALASNPNFSLEQAEEYNGDQDKYYLLRNPNITTEYIIENKLLDDNRYCYGLSINKFLYDDRVYKKSLEKDIQSRKEKVKEVLEKNKKLYKDIVDSIAKYVGYE